MAEGFSTKTRESIATRDGGRCWACGGVGQELHHRRRRRENGDGLAHTPANGVQFCGWGNHSGCHGRVHSSPAWARERGYIVRPGIDPATVPIHHFSRGWILLDSKGGWSPETVAPTDRRTTAVVDVADQLEDPLA